jgi:type IV fimbrial biogenesis protein FimT
MEKPYQVMPYIKNTKQSGVTLVEMMITLAVMAILLAIAIPAFESLIASTRLSTSTNDLLAAIAQSRSEAIRRGQRVVLCIQDPANAGQCINNGGWEQGWMAFIDADRDGIPDPGEAITLSTARQPANINIPANGGQSTITFLPSGRVPAVNTIRVCSTSVALSDDTRSRDISVNASGQAISQTPLGIPSNCPAP